VLIILIDKLPSSEAGFQSGVYHQAEIIDWVLESLHLIVQLIFLDRACSLEGETDIFGKYCQLVNVSSFQVGKACKVFGKS
jgi:hypothetical protein